MARPSRRWKDISITTRLQLVVGIMAMLIVAELATLGFAMDTLSAVRAFVSGEAHWSKSQKDGALALQRYARSHDESDFQAFLSHLEVPLGDRQARQELRKQIPDLEVVRKGFVAGGLDPDDIDPMIRMLRRFDGVFFLVDAIGAWADADAMILEFQQVGTEYHALIQSKVADPVRAEGLLARARDLNLRLTEKEDQFSEILGDGSQWLEGVIFKVLFAAVLVVEAIALTLTFLTSRSISHGLRDITDAANAIGNGDFDRKVRIESRDEIGGLAASVNRMGAMLKESYAELERRVEERTRELEEAVHVRDTFLSIASHELKTPLTSLKLQTQSRQRELGAVGGAHISDEKFRRMVESDDRQIRRLTRLVDDMLDVSLLRNGKFELKPEEFDLCDLVRQILERFKSEIADVGYQVRVELDAPVWGRWDHFRLEQVVINLITNAIKYGGRGGEIFVKVEQEGGRAYLTVRDHGMGIEKEDQSRIFRLFERASSARHFGGLGLGLFIAREIVHAHGGEISVLSALGVGSTFTVELDCYEAKANLAS